MGVASGLNALLQEHHTFVSGTAKRFGVSSSTLNQAVKNGKILRTGTHGMTLKFYRSAIQKASLLLIQPCFCMD